MIGICVLCGAFGEVNAHHFGFNKMVVCADCHGKYHGYIGKRRDRHQRLIGETSRMKLRELSAKYDVPEFGLPHYSMVKRIVKASNLPKEDDDALRAICKEMGTDYDILKKLKKEGKKG